MGNQSGDRAHLLKGSIHWDRPQKVHCPRVDREQESLSKIVTYGKDRTFSRAFEGLGKSTSFRYISWIITEGVSDHP